MSKLWFKRKLYGWGWTPATWQGWLIVLAYILFVFYIAFSIDEENVSMEYLAFRFFIPITLASIVLIIISYIKGEPPRWQWGKRVEN